MKKIIYRSQEDEQLIKKIESTSNYWYSEPLPDHTDILRKEFDRRLDVTSFNCPEGLLFICVVQVLTFKSTGDIYKKIAMPMWEVSAQNKENVMTADGLMVADEYDLDDDGDIMEDSKTEVEIKVNSAQYIRFLTTNRLMHVPDVFGAFMGIYKEKFATEINDI